MNFYKSAALALDHLEKNQGSVKGSLAAAGVQASGGEAKRILAIVIETLKYKIVLAELITTVPVLSLEKLTFPRKTPARSASSRSLVLVLLHDLLFSSRGIQASDKWEPKAALLRHQTRLKAELVRAQLRAGVSRKEDLGKKAATEGEVRYVRWNPNVDAHRSGDWSLSALEEHLATKRYTRINDPVYPVPEGKWFFDPHLSDCLLAFPASSNWWVGDKWYEAGAVILQDKASCFPARVLMEGWTRGEGEVIDGTAAPGNKTSYISALGELDTPVHAFERSPNRFKTLETMMLKGECRNVKARRADFLESDPQSAEWANVTRILLDPSCSGSGIVNRLDYLLEDAEVDVQEGQAARLEKLAGFQLQMILHAFKFPSAKRVVYSTCSIHAEEDEQVVMRALRSKEAQTSGWVLAPRTDVLPTWPRRGRPAETDGDKDLADSVIRCIPGEDKTNGFFVSCFVRQSAGDKPASTSIGGKAAKRKRGAPSDAPSVAVGRGTELAEDNVKGGAMGSEEAAAAEAEAEAEDADEADEASKDEALAPKAKTAAQAERARRKKAAQKKRRKIEIDA